MISRRSFILSLAALAIRQPARRRKFHPDCARSGAIVEWKLNPPGNYLSHGPFFIAELGEGRTRNAEGEWVVVRR